MKDMNPSFLPTHQLETKYLGKLVLLALVGHQSTSITLIDEWMIDWLIYLNGISNLLGLFTSKD